MRKIIIRSILCASLAINLAQAQTTYDSSTLVDTNNTSTSTSTVNTTNNTTSTSTSTSTNTVTTNGTLTNNNNNVMSGSVTYTNNNNNVNSGTQTFNNNNVNSGTMTYNNNNVNSGTMTYNNNNANTSTSTNTNLNVNSGTQTFNNNNNSTATSNNVNTNTNTSTNNNVNQNIQSGSMTNNNVNTSDITQRVIQPPPTAVAPTMMSGGNSDLCTTGTSGAVQTQIFGVSSGGTVRDENCERLKLSKTLYDMGMKVAAVATMCQDRRVFDAMMAAGTPCPYEGKIGEQAKALWDANPQRVPQPVKEKKDETHKNIGLGSLLGLVVYKLFK